VKVVAIAGGVGGAKLAFGLAQMLPPEDLTVVVNVGDDFTHMGLRICPDLDTVTYTLARLDNRETGWGLASDTFQALDALQRLEGPSWFRLGDRDLATHLWRTSLLAQGLRLTEATARICRSLGVGPTVLPATDDVVPTRVLTDEGELDFQDYFVRRRCEPRVSRIVFAGVEHASASPEVLAAMAAADAIVIAPSNPFVSVEPVLALASVRGLVASKPAVAVSPIVGGEAIKGPAAKMMLELGLDVSPAGVAQRYAGVIRGFVMDEVDGSLAAAIAATGLRVRTAQSIMRSDADRASLAGECLELLSELQQGA
jgi:LPPG:FO 2-phospho-L-lactate transferase